MLSYQHAYHAGNLADVHKHAALAVMLRYLCQKDKPLSYIETHAGRGLYDLNAVEALKTGEGQAGILHFEKQNRIPADHPYAECLRAIRARFGQSFYPGSPMIAAQMLRPDDKIHLAEKHPAEFTALQGALSFAKPQIQKTDGFTMARAILPPMPRRSLMLIDPSYEVKAEYEDTPARLSELHRKWPVGIIALWYPILTPNRHQDMIATLKAAEFPGALHHEIIFPPAQSQHRLTGSGLFIINAPYGLGPALTEIESWYSN